MLTVTGDEKRMIMIQKHLGIALTLTICLPPYRSSISNDY